MSSEYYNCETKYLIRNITEDETEQIESENHIDDIHDSAKGEIVIVKKEPTDIKLIYEYEKEQNATCYSFDVNISKEKVEKEEPTEFKPFNKYKVYIKSCLEQSEEEPGLNKSEFIERKGEEDLDGSKLSPTHICEYLNSNVDDSEYGLVDEQENPKGNPFNKGVEIKNENQDYSEWSGEFLTNYAGSATKTLKTEDDIDITHENVKPEIFGEKFHEMSEDKSYSLNPSEDMLMETTEMGPSFPHDFSMDLLQQNTITEEDCTDAKMDKNARKEPTTTNNSNNDQMLHSKKEDDDFNNGGVLFSSKLNKEIHKQTHTGDKPFQCKICSKSFARKRYLRLHGKVHTGDKPFQCKICSKSFAHGNVLKLHGRVHRGEKPFQCKICSKLFVAKQSLEKHMRIHTGEKSFQCEICSKSFARKSYLKLHERVHTGEKLFDCKICSKSFARQSYLKLHDRVHTGEKPFQCKICSITFVHKSALIYHESIHTGKKPFQCKICSKSFIYNSSLVYHERIHTGEKPFQCKICSKSFSRKSSFTIHERIHTGGKAFQCKICLKSFVQKAYFILHERIHSEEKPFQCKICPKSFTPICTCP